MKIIAVTSLLVLLVTLFYCCTEGRVNKKANTLTNVGSQKCQICHKKEFDAYLSSDHSHAMDTASSKTVLGDFNNSFFIYYGDTSFFYIKGDRYFVNTKDSTGVKKEFPVSFTFGWKPLQQYLVKFDDGRMQALPFCWDTRPKEKGGQRWFHIYGKEKIAPDDELFWMGYNQNWNYMCADCHTTNFSKNFNADENTFHSTWSESKVSCESCHGPASGHLQWTENKNDNTAFKGFPISLAARSTKWTMDNSKGTMVPEQILFNDTLVETCARCHARATRFTDEYHHGESFLQSHLPANVNTDNYYIDGQIKNEDYEYGSFLQSKMYANGVTCINCHDPHSMQLKADGNHLCTSCHSPEKFDVTAHTHHSDNSTGAQCANCHMPQTAYMTIDNRRDHSIRIPRPDLSLVSGSPNACNKCHTDKSVNWAAENFTSWYAKKLPEEKNYAELLYKISKFTSESESSLYDLLVSKKYPAIIKAAAVERFNIFSSNRITDQVLLLSSNNNVNVRLNALRAIGNLAPERVVPLIGAMLQDSIKAIRLEAVFILSPYKSQLGDDAKPKFEAALKEYLAAQESLSHRPEGFLNRGIILAQTGSVDEAAQLYLKGIKLFSKFIPFYINLADVYRAQNKATLSKEYIDKGLNIQPGNADLHYAAGLWYIREKDVTHGIAELHKAAALNPSGASIVYGYAISLFSTGKPKDAIIVLENYLAKNGNNPQVLDGLISISQDTKQADKANHYITIRKSVFGY